MCGIAGIVYNGPRDQESAAAVRRMIALQQHRGPDGRGFHDGEGVSLGHARLAILDLTETGKQPMSDGHGRHWITYNGEIYNYIELRKELQGLGHRFRGQSDTEVLLTAYCEWGEACVARLRGMFAFAIWDGRERRLFAARDRLGIKPFYWTDGKDRLAFASELKALLEFLPTREANSRLAREFLAWNLVEHQAGETMIAGIKRLPPAHTLSWRVGEDVALRRYWRLQVSEDLEQPASRMKSLAEEFRHRFEETIALHLRSDVPVGTCLSGGLDSSAIVCVARNELQRRGDWPEGWQHTFSACFDTPRIDERPYIEAVCASTGCQSHYVFPQGDKLRDELDTWLWHLEEPIGSTGSYAQFCVARLARQHGVKVLLDGQGADEQLAGYRKFILIYLRELVRARHFARAGRQAFAFLGSRAILRTSRFADGRRYLFNSVTEVEELWPGNDKPFRPASLGLRNSIGARIEADLTRFSLPILLRLEDRCTMAFGIEERVPFVDHELVEWLATLPAEARLADGWTKRIMREALVDVLPERVRTRKSKLGFSTPEPEWLAGPLAGWLRETLASPIHLGELVELDGLRRLRTKYDRGDRSLALQNVLFRLALYETWARQFLSVGSSSFNPKREAVLA